MRKGLARTARGWWPNSKVDIISFVLTPAYGAAPTGILGPSELVMAQKTDEYYFIEKIEESQDAYIEIGGR